jgi:hypothetical protein
MAGDGIRAYAGEFLVSPAGLELSMNWCGHACTYCIEENSPVMLANLRTKPGKAVQVGDVLLGFQSRGVGAHREWAPAVVEEVFAREVPGVRVHLANGETITCTPDHHFWTGRRGVIEYAPICTVGPYSRMVVRPGRALHRIRLPLLTDEPFCDDYRRGYICGLLEGDASTTPYGAWRIALKDPEPLERVAAFVSALGWASQPLRAFKDYTATPGRSPMQQLYFPVEHPVSRLMASADAAEQREYWRGWLAGIYDAEGSTPARRSGATQSALRICQHREKNPITYRRIEEALLSFGFQFVSEDKAIRLVNAVGLAAPLFVQFVQPAITRKANSLMGRSLKGLQERIPVVRVEDAGMIRVASFRTSTHNYVSGGFLSRNCFANAFKPDRKADLSGIMGLLANYRTRSTREAKLLQAGVPMLVSNHVDPFAGTNAEQFEPIWELCMELQIPLTWQTRGAHKPQRPFLEKVIRENPPSVWYVSIPMLDDAVRKRVEPMAPSIESRFELVEQLVAAGHVVTVGVNPLTLDWVPDFEPLLNRIKDLGAWGAWIEVA